MVTSSYGYDDIGRLVSATNSGGNTTGYGYSYDPVGNLLEATLDGTAYLSPAYNANNQQCWLHDAASGNGCNNVPGGATVFAYDANGNQTGGAHAFAYGPLDQAISIDGITMTYTDVDSMECTGCSGGGPCVGSSADDVFGSFLLGHTFTTDGATTTLFMRRPDTGQLVASRSGTDSVYFHADHLGTIRALTDASGAVVAEYSYDPYGGHQTAIGVSAAANPYRYRAPDHTELTKFGTR